MQDACQILRSHAADSLGDCERARYALCFNTENCALTVQIQFKSGRPRVMKGKVTGEPQPKHARISRLWVFPPRPLSDSDISSFAQCPTLARRAGGFPGTFRESAGCVSCAFL